MPRKCPEISSHSSGWEEKPLAGSGDSELLYPNKSGFHKHLSVLQKRLSPSSSSLPSCPLSSSPSHQLQKRRDTKGTNPEVMRSYHQCRLPPGFLLPSTLPSLPPHTHRQAHAHTHSHTLTHAHRAPSPQRPANENKRRLFIPGLLQQGRCPPSLVCWLRHPDRQRSGSTL